jgi:5-methylcytosine-specific restriction enzyme A
MTTALFINGIYDDVLSEILDAQQARDGGESFIQPYKGQVIKMLSVQQPTPETPIRLYLSTTEDLSRICYTAKIVRWEDKRELTDLRRSEVRRHLEEFQPGEANLFTGMEEIGKKAVNLISIHTLNQLDTHYPTNLLRKVSDGLPLKKRTRSGGWSEVHDDLRDLIELPAETKERYDDTLTLEIRASMKLSDTVIKERLSTAPRMPEKMQFISVGYRRNSNVIVSVLRRANGFCELCGNEAPFLRRSDGSPYLEVHHLKPLSQGGEDITDNAAALCPNCHRKIHHGQING